MNIKLAHWPAPKNIKAACTMRHQGHSQGPYACNNLALHVNDDPAAVLKNREQLREDLQLLSEPLWLNQTHSTHCIIAEETTTRDADAAISRSAAYPLAILTADCLPIVLCSRHGDEIAAIHAGWRGLYQGIVENTLSKMRNNPNDLMAWIGPAISQAHYEVGAEVYDSFTNKIAASAQAFQAEGEKWMANLAQIAELILHNHGVEAVYQSGLCTFELKNDFYSYRRAAQTGRIATLIWFHEQPQD